MKILDRLPLPLVIIKNIFAFIGVVATAIIICVLVGSTDSYRSKRQISVDKVVDAAIRLTTISLMEEDGDFPINLVDEMNSDIADIKIGLNHANLDLRVSSQQIIKAMGRKPICTIDRRISEKFQNLVEQNPNSWVQFFRNLRDKIEAEKAKRLENGSYQGDSYNGSEEEDSEKSSDEDWFFREVPVPMPQGPLPSPPLVEA
jgi:hypothetical protein